VIRPGVRIGIDAGTVRIGVARSDASGTLAVPVETVRRGKGDLDRIAQIVMDWEAIEVVVGLPRTLRGQEGTAAGSARVYAGEIAARVAPVPVRLVDERLTTVTAQQSLRNAGVRGPKGRSVVDQAAAVIILQSALDEEGLTQAPPGTPVQAKGAGGEV
jgi:putative Holliday junction resolvase